MQRRFIDLSMHLENDVQSDPPGLGPKIDYHAHKGTFEQMSPFFPGLKQSDLPDGEAWAVEDVWISPVSTEHLRLKKLQPFTTLPSPPIEGYPRGLAVDKLPRLLLPTKELVHGRARWVTRRSRSGFFQLRMSDFFLRPPQTRSVPSSRLSYGAVSGCTNLRCR